MKPLGTSCLVLATLTLLASSSTSQVAREPTLFDGEFGIQSGALTLLPDGGAAVAYLGYSGGYSSSTFLNTSEDAGKSWSADHTIGGDLRIEDDLLFSGATHVRGIGFFADQFGCCTLNLVSVPHDLSGSQRVSLVTSVVGYVQLGAYDADFTPDPLGGFDDTTFVVFEADLAGGAYEVFFVRADGGSSVAAPLSLSAGSASLFSIEDVAIAAVDDTVYVAWADDQAGADRIALRISTDGGATFGPEIQHHVTGGSVVRDTLRLEAEGDAFALAWQETGGLFVTTSVDRGLTLAGPIPLDATADDSALALIGSDPLVGWRSGDTVYSALSVDGGLTYTTQTLASGVDATAPLAVDGNSKGVVVLLAFGAFDGSEVPLEAIISEDGGRTWTTRPVVVDSLPSSSINRVEPPLVEVDDSGNVFTGWRGFGLSLNLPIGGFALEPFATAVPFSVPGNQDSLTAEPPVIGATPRITLDHLSTGQPGGVVVAALGTAMIPALGQTLLVDLTSPPVFRSGLIAGAPATVAVPIPNDPTMLGTALYLQGAHVGSGVALTNRIDLLVGAR